jgi:prepilin-type N-terminal cleavage/methylation domain-containing protein
MINKKITNTNSGFTILEMVVVIFIISFGLLGVVSLVNQSIQVGNINKNMLIASQLSQEGLELVRNKRDINWLERGDWEFSSTTNSRLDIIRDGTYIVDYTGAINSAPDNISDQAAKLYLDANGFYSHSASANPTPFYRLITVGNESVSSTTVRCDVQWKKGTNTYSFSAQTVLYDWR